MDEDVKEWLLKARDGPIRRDGNRDGVPFDLATRLLADRLIETDTEFSHDGIARMQWRVWRITPRGVETLARLGCDGV